MHNLAQFSLQDMTLCSAALRTLGANAGSLDDAADCLIRYLYDHLIDGQTGTPGCALIRFFKTQAYRDLSPERQAFARNILGDIAPWPDMKCLSLIATAGQQPAWNHTDQSRRYKAIPLADAQFVAQFPMLSQLFIQLGVKLDTALRPSSDLLMDVHEHTFNVFYVENAVGSPFVPVQQDFVIPYGIRSVLSVGGLLPSRELFVIVLFSKVPISRRTADLFKPLALSAKLALLPFDSCSSSGESRDAANDGQRRESQIVALEQLLTVQEEAVGTYAAERRHAEVARADSEEKLNALVHSTKDAIVFLDRSGAIKSWNHAARALFGYSITDTHGKPGAMLLVAECEAIFQQAVKQAGKGSRAATCEAVGLRKEGCTFSLELTVSPWSVRTGPILLATFRDVTERTRIAHALRQSESKLRGLIEHAPDIIMTLSVDGIITSLNPAFETMTHWPLTQWIGQPFGALLHEADAESAREIFEYMRNTRCPITCVLRVQSRDRGILMGEIVGSPLMEDDRVVGLLAMVRDITGRKMIEDALRESEEQLRSVVQSTQDAIISLDRDGVVVFWNAGAEKIFGYAVDEMLNQRVTKIIPERFRDAHQRGIMRAAAAGRLTVSGSMFELVGLRKDGTEFPLEFTLAAWKSESGMFFTGIIRDITERKRAENELTALLQGTASVTGREFFPVLVRELATALGGRYTSVAEIVSEEPMRFRVLASWENGRPGDVFEYDAAETPCEAAMQHSSGYYYTDRVQEVFPRDRYLRRYNVKGFLAVPLLHSSGRPIGCLRVMDPEPLKNEQHAKTIMTIFAARAAAELERLRATAALHESEARQALILNALPLVFYTAKASGDFDATWVSKNLELMTGFPPQTFLERPGFWAGRLHPQDRACVLASLEQGRDGGTISNEYRWQTADGSYRWFLDNAVYMRDADGRPKEIIGAWLDITDRKDVEHALHLSEERLRLSLSATQLGIWDWDIAADCVVWSDAVAPILGLPPASTATFNLYLTLVHPDDRMFVTHAVRRALEGVASYAIENRVLWPDGSVHWVSCNGEVLRDSNGKAVRMYGTVQDITERKHREAELHSVLTRVRTLSGRLEVVREEERGRIARELHDEFGVGLTCLKIDLSRLRSLIGPTVGLEKGRQIEEKIRSMGEFIDTTIGGVQRIVSELRPAILDDLGLTAAIEWQAQDFQRRTGIVCVLTVDDENFKIEPERATAVFRICQEALTNVARHAGASTVSIRLEQRSGVVTLQITDNGRGIAQDKTAHPQSLGLLGMRERAQLFGGWVAVAARPEGGTSVTLQLPCARPSPTLEESC